MNKGSFFYLKIQIFKLHLLLFFPGPVYSITLTMKEIVLVDTQITLGTFISVKDSSYSLKKQIEGCTLTLEQDRIHLIPSYYVRELVSRFTHQSVIITGRTTALLPLSLLKNWSDESVHQFVEFLQSTLCEKDNRVEAEILSFPYDALLYQGEKPAFYLKTRREYMGFPVGEIMVHTDIRGYNEYDREDIRLNVHQYIPVLKSKTYVGQNEALTRDKLIIKEEKLDPFRGEVLLPHEYNEDLFTIKKLESGEIIYKSYVKIAMKVRAGEKVTIIFKKGKILLSMTGRAGDSGIIGDSVKVRPSQSTEWVIGRVTGTREVFVEM